MATRDELVVALKGRYISSNRQERGRILDEFVAVSGLHRKHAMRLLRAGRPGQRSGPRRARRLYNDAVREALIVLWEASDRICGKRLRPLVPILVEAMEQHGHLQLAPEVRLSLLAMSAATIDRALHEVREPGGGRRRRHAPPSAAIRRSVAVRTFDGWDNPPPGYVEADLVAHSGPTAKGSFVQTLTLTDIATGWTECAPMLVHEQKLLTEVLNEMRQRMPFPLLGFDADNATSLLSRPLHRSLRHTSLQSEGQAVVIPLRSVTSQNPPLSSRVRFASRGLLPRVFVQRPQLQIPSCTPVRGATLSIGAGASAADHRERRRAVLLAAVQIIRAMSAMARHRTIHAPARSPSRTDRDAVGRAGLSPSAC